MSENFGRDRQDIRSELKNDGSHKSKPDFGGELSNEAGVDLNDSFATARKNLAKEYSYEDYLESGDFSNPLEVEPPPETNEYTGSEYTDFPDNYTPEFNKNIEKDIGDNLNDIGSDQLVL
jgi:hypothetical protein